MKQQKQLLHKKQFLKARNACFISYLFLGLAFFGTISVNAQVATTTTLAGNNTTVYLPSTSDRKLIVYKDVPSHLTDLKLQIKPSNQYRIQVRIKNLINPAPWQEVFAHKTYNRFKDALPDIEYDFGNNPDGSKQNYVDVTGDWSHTYGNIEMVAGTEVEVKITKLNGSTTTTPTPVAITYAAAHPSTNATFFTRSLANGVATFTIVKPCQITVDFGVKYNSLDSKTVDISLGAMDTRNRGIAPNTNDVYNPVHTVTLFANPIMVKPLPTDNNVQTVEPGTIPLATFDKQILYFKPGVHNLGINFKLLKGKHYYIPGDAIVYGTMNNFDKLVNYSYYIPKVGAVKPYKADDLTRYEATKMTSANPGSGFGIKVYGYGTISGYGTTNPGYVDPYPSTVPIVQENYKALSILSCQNTIVDGITIADPANHSVNLEVDAFDSAKLPGFYNRADWVKIISWRANGDGIGECHLVNNGFFRTNDDAGYIKGSKSNCIFWKDHNAAVFFMSGIPNKFVLDSSGKETTTLAFFPIKIDNCEVIYARSRSVDGSSNTGVFHLRGGGTKAQTDCRYTVDVTVNDFTVSDLKSNMPVFNIFNKDGTSQGPMYDGMIFNRMKIDRPVETVTGTTIKYPMLKINVNQTTCLTGTTLPTTITFKDCKINNAFFTNSDFTLNPVSNTLVNLNLIVTSSSSRIGVKSKENNDSASGIKVYSNPDSKILHVDFPNADLSREIQVYSLLGQMVYKTTSQKNSNEIDVKSLNLSGVIIVKVTTGDEVSSHKVLVQ